MSRQSVSPRAALFALPVLLVALLASSCSRSVTLGYEEAVEVMVLDGVDRARAACIVSVLDGELELAKVTGLDVDLSDDELSLLAATSSRCAPALAAPGGIVGGAPIDEASIAAAIAAAEAEVDIDTAVYRMVEEGLDPTIAECLIVRLAGSFDPAEVLADDVRLSSVVVDCRAELE